MTHFLYRWAVVTGLLTSVAAEAGAQVRRAPSAPVALPSYLSVDTKISQVPDSSTRTVAGLTRYINATFSTEDDKARAAFAWVARNVRYDVENQFTVMFFLEPAQLVREALARRTGVCTHYAELYAALTNQVGVKSYVVPGYTRQSDGTVATVGHAWCATRIGGQWYLMDPTWAAGYVKDDAFVPRLNNEYYKVRPASFIRHHMPFDPLWQLLPAPRTALQFQKGSAPEALARPFSVADSLAAYERQSVLEQLRATNQRVEQNGVKNGLTFSYLADNRQRELNYYSTVYNEALNAYNAGINKLNAFIDFFNRQFQPKKSDDELKLLVPAIAADFARARALQATVHLQAPEQLTMLKQFQESLQQAETKVQNCQAFVDRYLRTSKLMRPLQFRTISGENEMMR